MGTLENTIRNGILSISQKGTYGTSGFMSEKEAEEVLKLTSSLKKHTGTILGILAGTRIYCPLFLPGISGTLGFLGLPFGNQRR